MAIPTGAGRFDIHTGRYLPENTGTWGDLSGSSWGSWGSWLNDPDTEIVYLSPILELPRNTPFNLNIETVADGEVSYRVYTSDTGAFGGEETETVIANTATNISAFEGQYVLVAVEVQSTGPIASLTSVNVSTNTTTYRVSRNSVDTSTLSGSVGARVIPLPAGASYVWSASISARAGSYTQDVYVTDYPSATTLIASIESQTTSGVTVKLVGLDNVARDGTIDYDLVLLAKMNMANGNLITT